MTSPWPLGASLVASGTTERGSSVMLPLLLHRLAEPRFHSLLDLALVILQVPKRTEVSKERRFGVRSGPPGQPEICDQGFLAGDQPPRLGDTFSSGDQGSVLSRHYRQV